MPFQSPSRLKIAAYVGGMLGLVLLVGLVVRSDLPAMWRTLRASAAWNLLWLTPYRVLFFLLYAIGWRALLRPYDRQHRAGLGYTFWVTTVREAVDRLLPVASVGGSFIAVRLMRWRGLAASGIAATVAAEIVLTLSCLYLLTAVGLFLLSEIGASDATSRHILLALLLGLPVPVVTALLLRYGSVFGRIEAFLRPMLGEGALSDGAAALDRELHACLSRGWTLAFVGALQFAALLSASFEIWLALRLFGHPVDARGAVMLECMTQALRHVAFIVPAGLGVQEAAFVLFGHALGVGSGLAIAVSMAKRLREVLCGLPALASWQLMEAARLRAPVRSP
ncbi:MAG TPA: lysylphosphatidylglycerol synthase domain-containing protein [Steroidobacteraceae bacterium]|nr:lysylphosphatidylglycerol synthase domain-containing protein [Steroidobacteraceae bacterium]